MTVAELISQLDGVDPDAEVRIASQPNCPFEYAVARVHEQLDLDGPTKTTLYLVEGRQIGYLPGAVRDEIGW